MFEGQLIKAIKEKIKINTNYMHMEASYDVFVLMRTLEAISFKFEGHKHQARVLHYVEANF